MHREVVLWEGQEAPARGMTPAPTGPGQEAIPVLPGRDPQALDGGIRQTPSPESSYAVPLLGFGKEGRDPHLAFAPGLVVVETN